MRGKLYSMGRLCPAGADASGAAVTTGTPAPVRPPDPARATLPPRAGRVPPAGRFTRISRVDRRLTCVTVCLLAACSVGPRYTRPAVPLPAEWRAPGETTLESPTQLAWWQVFQDPVLETLIATALAENKDLRLAVARVREARAQVAVARGAQFPTLDALGAYVYARIPVPPSGAAGPQPAAGTPVLRLFNAILDLSYEVDVWGRLAQNTRAARADYRATAFDEQVVRITLIGDVAQAYVDLLALDRMAAVNRSTIASRDSSLELVTRRFQGGLTSELDVRRAEQELAAAAAVLPGIERQIAQTENRLSLLLGRNPGPIPRGPPLDLRPQPPELPAGTPSELIQRRPDIREVEQRIIAANARTRAAVAGLLPRFSLTAFYGGQSPEPNHLLNENARMWLVVPYVRLPISHGGALRATVAVARAREAETVVEYERSVQQALREVEDALAFQRTARQARELREVQRGAAERALELANLRYAEGLGSYLDVLDAERQQFNAELDLAAAMADELSAVVHLYKALGGGWEPRPSPRDPQ